MRTKQNVFDYKKTIYSISVEDIQTVALKEIGRELSIREIESIIDDIGERIPWYDIIDIVITEKINPKV